MRFFPKNSLQSRSQAGYFSTSYLNDLSRRLSSLAFEEYNFNANISREEPSTSARSSTDTEVQTAIVIHGLFGSSRNWRTPIKMLGESILSRSLGKTARAWRFVLVDLRNHGKTANLYAQPRPHTIESSAVDILRLIQEHNWSVPVVLGHSLGGKVAMEIAKAAAGSLPTLKTAWVLDSVPGLIKGQGGDVDHVIDTLKSFPKIIPSRRWLLDELKGLGFSKGLSDWMASNLQKLNPASSGEEMTWMFNVDGAAEMYDSYKKKDFRKLLESPPAGLQIEFVRAEKSDRWQKDVLQELEAIVGGRFGHKQVGLHTLPNAGHWLHVDNPKGLIQILQPSFE